MSGKFDFRTSFYFSGTMRMVAVVFFAVAVVLAVTNIAIAVVLALISVIAFTTTYRFSVDFEAHTYRDYVWLLGLRLGETRKFVSIDYFFVKKQNVSQTFGLRVATSTIRRQVYDAYLRFSDSEKVHIMTRDDHRDLMERLKPIADRMHVAVVDYSQADVFEVQ